MSVEQDTETAAISSDPDMPFATPTPTLSVISLLATPQPQRQVESAETILKGEWSTLEQDVLDPEAAASTAHRDGEPSRPRSRSVPADGRPKTFWIQRWLLQQLSVDEPSRPSSRSVPADGRPNPESRAFMDRHVEGQSLARSSAN